MSHITEKYFDDIVKTIKDVVKFDTSQKPAEDGYPFGKENAECLNYFLKLAEKMGFETHNYDNYVGEVIFGDGEPLAILAHLDVVPAGDGWKFPPFDAVVNDEISAGGVGGTKIWGRGTMDDKGPAVVTLYCMKALKDSGFVPKRKIKFIVGCNEETGWACLEHYVKVASMPSEGFSPDASFPAIYAEKGILHFNTFFNISAFEELSAGDAANMVCDKASAIIKDDFCHYAEKICESDYKSEIKYDKNSKKITFYGKSAHGSTPEKGINALYDLLKFASCFDGGCKLACELLFNDKFALKSINDETGYLTMSPDMASLSDGKLKITTDIRFPATHKKEEIENLISSFGVPFEIIHFQEPLYNDPNGKLIKTLMSVYNNYTGKDEKPIAIGGGTYARALKCGCGFGPELEDEEATIHQPNEYITFERIKMMSVIYYEAIKELTK